MIIKIITMINDDDDDNRPDNDSSPVQLYCIKVMIIDSINVVNRSVKGSSNRSCGTGTAGCSKGCIITIIIIVITVAVVIIFIHFFV